MGICERVSKKIKSNNKIIMNYFIYPIFNIMMNNLTLIKNYCVVMKNAFKWTWNIKLVIIIFYVLCLWLLWRLSKKCKEIYIWKSGNFWHRYIYNTSFWNYICRNFHDACMLTEDYELSIQNEIKNIAKSKKDWDIFINIWANIWRWSIALTKQYWYKTIAFEPAPETFKALQFNSLLSNTNEQINICNFWLWNEKWYLNFEYNIARNWWSKFIEEQKNKEWTNLLTVAVNKFDDFIDANYISKIRLIIMDVEGYEYQVLQWMYQSLKGFKDIKIIMEILKDNKNKSKTINFMTNLWYIMKQIDDDNYLFSK